VWDAFVGAPGPEEVPSDHKRWVRVPSLAPPRSLSLPPTQVFAIATHADASTLFSPSITVPPQPHHSLMPHPPPPPPGYRHARTYTRRRRLVDMAKGCPNLKSLCLETCSQLTYQPGGLAGLGPACTVLSSSNPRSNQRPPPPLAINVVASGLPARCSRPPPPLSKQRPTNRLAGWPWACLHGACFLGKELATLPSPPVLFAIHEDTGLESLACA
jgi:hypothetical protein